MAGGAGPGAILRAAAGVVVGDALAMPSSVTDHGWESFYPAW